jgi:hypothetical protein
MNGMKKEEEALKGASECPVFPLALAVHSFLVIRRK